MEYNLIKEIQDEVDRSWSSGRKIFSYRLPTGNAKDNIICTLADDASQKVGVEVIGLRHLQLATKISTILKNDCSNIRFNFWEQSKFFLENGIMNERLVLIDGATEQIMGKLIEITAGNPGAPCVILIE